MDNLLPLYAKVIDDLCPCDKDTFAFGFNERLAAAFTVRPTRKTLDNHRTEIAGQLFGMFYINVDNTVYSSERTQKFLSDSDTPAFFKDICYKMQFPNGSQKWSTLKERIDNRINIRQFPFVLKVLLLAKSNAIVLTKKDIGYYILNSLDVLQGIANPLEVFDAILSDKQQGIERELGTGSHEMQHINEQINLLELANLIFVDNGEVTLNHREMEAIQLFAENYAAPPAFNVYSYDLNDADTRKHFYLDWEEYFSKLSEKAGLFDTTTEALGILLPEQTDETEEQQTRVHTTEIGDEGERYVYEYERNRVGAYNFRLVNKVIHLGKTRGLGYDIQSVVAQPGEDAEFVKYIEVKATKRVTAPKYESEDWFDTINITRNEWVASQQHKNSYSIFRVYFIRDAVLMFVMTNIAQKCSDGIIQAVPTMYRIDFTANAVDEIISSSGGAVENA
jgi:hypothetical protein